MAVLAVLASGPRDKVIAPRLSQSPRTIDHHPEAILTKLGVAVTESNERTGLSGSAEQVLRDARRAEQVVA